MATKDGWDNPEEFMNWRSSHSRSNGGFSFSSALKASFSSAVKREAASKSQAISDGSESSHFRASIGSEVAE